MDIQHFFHSYKLLSILEKTSEDSVNTSPQVRDPEQISMINFQSSFDEFWRDFFSWMTSEHLKSNCSDNFSQAVGFALNLIVGAMWLLKLLPTPVEKSISWQPAEENPLNDSGA